ncbi:MAG: nitroreductase family protein [Erysipelotrichaceae bacterium]|nr:nitroreductase family protein [Erysipelotrichaceae bacterium]
MKEIFERTSVRQYTDEKVTDEQIEKLLKAAMAAPSAMNRQPWEFIVVQDPEMLQKLGSVTPYSTPVARSNCTIVTLADTGNSTSNIYLHDLGAACENILLEAVHLGLGTVWMAVTPSKEREQAVRELLNIPENIVPFSMIAVGYPAGEVKPKDKFKLEKIHYEKYKAV